MSFSKEGGISVKRQLDECLSPHSIAVLALVSEFFKFRDSAIFLAIPNAIHKPRHLRDFCGLTLKLIQSPDLTVHELFDLLSHKAYTIHPEFLSQFVSALKRLDGGRIGPLLDLFDAAEKLIYKESDEEIVENQPTQITKSSIVGCYIRRLCVCFHKLSFSGLTAVLKAFRHYYSGGGEDTRGGEEGAGEQWSGRQAELFVASQAALLAKDEERACDPRQLRTRVQNALASNPDLAEAHFLDYLNYLRIKEFCGAVDSLYRSFDHSIQATGKMAAEDKKRCYRFAVLNLAILHFHFKLKDDALSALKEAIRLAQEANDNVCLQHALSWLYCLTDLSKDKLLEHSILKSLDLNLSYTMSLGIQSFAQYAGVNGATPKQIFATITKSDILNCQNTYVDLIGASHAQKSALWSFYGKTEMASLSSQLLLTLVSENSCYAEPTCHALCNVALAFLLRGHQTMAYATLSLAKDRFPNGPSARVWSLCENLLRFERSLCQGKLADAEIAAKQLAVLDLWEGHLRTIELLLHKRDFSAAHACISTMLQQRGHAKAKIRMDQQTRAMILLGRIHYSGSYNVIPPAILNIGLSNANDYHVDWHGSMILVHIANTQFLLGMPGQALRLLDRAAVQVLAHGGHYDRACLMLLYVKCLVASAQHQPDEKRVLAVKEAAAMLNEVRRDFKEVGAYLRQRDTLYLQARLYDEVNMQSERNRCALKYRLMQEEHSFENSAALLSC